jgi:hypothetical protein
VWARSGDLPAADIRAPQEVDDNVLHRTDSKRFVRDVRNFQKCGAGQTSRDLSRIFDRIGRIELSGDEKRRN